jgi:hypothetical protein
MLQRTRGNNHRVDLIPAQTHLKEPLNHWWIKLLLDNPQDCRLSHGRFNPKPIPD